MALGILGTGQMGTSLAVMFARAGQEVVLGSWDAEHGRRVAEGLNVPGLVGGSYKKALSAPVILPAVLTGPGLVHQLRPWRNALAGKILIDITNPFNGDQTDFVSPWAPSGSEEISAAFPYTPVVGVFKNLWWEAFDPNGESVGGQVHVVSDDQDAKCRVLKMCARTPFSYVDAGGLAQARRLERMPLLSGVGRGFAA